MSRSIPVICAALCVVLLSATSAQAHPPVERRGSCTGGSGEWRLTVQREDRDSLRLEFEIKDVPVGETWQVFISDNGSRVFSGSRAADDGGDVRVRKIVRNHPGLDRIAASGVNAEVGATCGGSLSY